MEYLIRLGLRRIPDHHPAKTADKRAQQIRVVVHHGSRHGVREQPLLASLARHD